MILLGLLLLGLLLLEPLPLGLGLDKRGFHRVGIGEDWRVSWIRRPYKGSRRGGQLPGHNLGIEGNGEAWGQ